MAIAFIPAHLELLLLLKRMICSEGINKITRRFSPIFESAFFQSKIIQILQYYIWNGHWFWTVEKLLNFISSEGDLSTEGYSAFEKIPFQKYTLFCALSSLPMMKFRRCIWDMMPYRSVLNSFNYNRASALWNFVWNRLLWHRDSYKITWRHSVVATTRKWSLFITRDSTRREGTLRNMQPRIVVWKEEMKKKHTHTKTATITLIWIWIWMNSSILSHLQSCRTHKHIVQMYENDTLIQASNE